MTDINDQKNNYLSETKLNNLIQGAQKCIENNLFDTLKFVRVMEVSKIFIDLSFPENSIDPLFVCSLILNQITYDKEIDTIIDIDNVRYLIDEVADRLDMVINDFNECHLIYLEKINNENNKKFDSLLNLDTITQSNLINKAYRKMIKNEKKVYETENFSKYLKQIIFYLDQEFNEYKKENKM